VYSWSTRKRRGWAKNDKTVLIAIEEKAKGVQRIYARVIGDCGNDTL